MKVATLKNTLKQLAELYEDAGELNKASALLKLATVLDDSKGEQKVAILIKEIRRARGLSAT